jgi:hypothetical protein
VKISHNTMEYSFHATAYIRFETSEGFQTALANTMMISASLLPLLAGLTVLQPAVWGLTGQQIVSDLRAQLSSGSEIVLTSDAAYASDFTARFDITAPPTYSVGVKPALAGDVQKVVSSLA